jgi:hypothetical protein
MKKKPAQRSSRRRKVSTQTSRFMWTDADIEFVPDKPKGKVKKRHACKNEGPQKPSP